MEKRDEIQKEALNKSLEYNRCTLALSMRTGKTKIGLDRINLELEKNKNLKVLIVAPKLSIRQSWKDDAVKFKMKYLLDHITFSTYISLNKQDLNYDMLILDENHSLLSTHIQYLSKFKGKILGLTGTPPKHTHGNKAKIISAYCPVVYKYITNDAVEDQVLNDYRILVHMIDISDRKNVPIKRKDGRIFYNSEKEIYNYWGNRIRDSNTPRHRQLNSIMRMKAMQGFPSKVEYAKWLLKSIEDKCIVFTNTQAQAEDISKYSYHSKNPNNEENLRLFKEGIIQILACVNQISEGITIPGLNTGLIFHFYSDSSAKGAQRFGRLLGLTQDEIATLHILCYKGTVDEDWVSGGLEDLDQSKIRYVNFKIE